MNNTLLNVGSSVYFPAAQIVQEVEPAVELFPEEHVVHFATPDLDESTAFTDVNSVPAGQDPHRVKPAFAQ